jgi:hypothetical protein
MLSQDVDDSRSGPMTMSGCDDVDVIVGDG